MSTTISGVVDYIGTDDIATIEIQNEQGDLIDFPISLLPKNTREGDFLRIIVAQDPEARKTASREDIELGGFQKHLGNLSSRGT